MNAQLPDAIQVHLANHVTRGTNLRTESDASVFPYESNVLDDLYLKISSSRSDPPLAFEATAMRWLKDKVNVPRVAAYHKENATEYLVTTRLSGIDASETDLHSDKAAVIRLFAESLRTLHALEAEDCPQNWTPESSIERGRRRVADGPVSHPRRLLYAEHPHPR